MTDCPVCDRPVIGGQIVELPHPSTDNVTYAVACPNCGTVYEDSNAREQIEGRR